MKKRMILLGSSVLGLAIFGATGARAADDVAVDAAPGKSATVTTETTTTKDTGKVQRGFYAGGTIGGSFFEGPSNNSKIFNHSTDDSNLDGRTDAFTTDGIGQQDNFMWTVFGGYRMADWLGAEVGWTDIGGFKATDINGPGDPPSPSHHDSVSARVDGVEARLRAWYPFPFLDERISGIGGLGIFIFAAHGQKKCNGTDTSGCDKIGDYPPTAHTIPALDPREDSGQAFTLSAGLQFRVTDNILIRTEYQHFFSVLDTGVDMVTASVVFGFYDLFHQGESGGESIGGVTVE